jgi:hypothetical protein
MCDGESRTNEYEAGMCISSCGLWHTDFNLSKPIRTIRLNIQEFHVMYAKFFYVFFMYAYFGTNSYFLPIKH